jgi:hypothetical protein
MRALLLIGLLTACETGGDSPTLPDADLTKPMCTGVVYDSCTTAAGCASMNCKLYEDINAQVCTQTCDATTPCPVDSTGVVGKCNNRGICKPAAPNACHP